AAGYATLTFYDYFALRTIGRHNVPYPIAALASFTSYSIGHNLGATVFTGGAVRLRIYSAWGLGVVDVAKIAFVTGLTFWLGNAFVLGLSMAYAPEAASAVDQLPPWLNRCIALAGLATIVGYVLWLLPGPRRVGYGNWRITLPRAALTFVQIGIGIADLTIGALAVYVVLPAEPAIHFPALLVTFVFATLLGFVSHAPGSLGVFDAVMLVALTQFDKNELIASLLVFRALYFILPFFMALCLLSARELWLSLRGDLGPRRPRAGTGHRTDDCPGRAGSCCRKARQNGARTARSASARARWRGERKRASLAPNTEACMTNRLAILALLLCAAGLGGFAARAEDYPRGAGGIRGGFSAGARAPTPPPRARARKWGNPRPPT